MSQAVMDATEIARLRELLLAGDQLSEAEVFSLLAALEQAQNERDATQATIVRWRDRLNESFNMGVEYQVQRDAAQKDAKDARALLADIEMAFEQRFRMPNAAWQEATAALRARIEAMLEKKI